MEWKAWRPLGPDTQSTPQAEMNKNLLTSSKCEGHGGLEADLLDLL